MSTICTQCGHCGPTKTHTKGSFLIELVLWICALLPGLIYSLWRLTTRQRVCRKCESSSLVPADTPRGRQLLEQFGVAQPAARP
jgi:proteolipid membrane potential modulator